MEKTWLGQKRAQAVVNSLKRLDRCVNQANVIFDHIGPCKKGVPDGVQIMLPPVFTPQLTNPSFRNRWVARKWHSNPLSSSLGAIFTVARRVPRITTPCAHQTARPIQTSVWWKTQVVTGSTPSLQLPLMALASFPTCPLVRLFTSLFIFRLP